VAHMGEGRGVYRLGGPKARDHMELRDLGIDGANWIRLAQDRVRWRAFL
jgi:hypothetical protein